MQIYDSTPDPDGAQLRRTIAAQYGLSERHVFLGNGSDEVLAHTFLGLLKHAQPVLFPDITYSFYPVYCALYDIDYEALPVGADFRVEAAGYARENGGIVLPNPNAPTGLALSLSEIRRIVAASPDSVVVVDEAYVDFGAESAVPLVREFPNVLIAQTLSKSRSLAGLRVGYAIGDPGLIDALNTVKGCFNAYPLDSLALAGAQAAFADSEYFTTTCAAIVADREWLTAQLTGLGFAVLPSLANFLFVHHPQHDALGLKTHLRAKNILVRHFTAPRIEDYLRITIGTHEACEALLEALSDIVN